MIYTQEEELLIIFYLLSYGIYIISSLDIIQIILDYIKKKFIKIIIYILFWIIQIYITIIFSYNLVDGYLPIYFPVLIIFGFYIYNLLLKTSLIKSINTLIKYISILFKKLIPLFISKTLIKYIDRLFKHELRIIKKIKKTSKKIK